MIKKIITGQLLNWFENKKNVIFSFYVFAILVIFMGYKYKVNDLYLEFIKKQKTLSKHREIYIELLKEKNNISRYSKIKNKVKNIGLIETSEIYNIDNPKDDD